MPVLWYDEIPGGWTYFKEEANRFASRGYEIAVVCPHPGETYDWPVRVYRCKSQYLIARGFVINPLSFISCMNRVFREVGPIDLLYDDTSGLYPMGFALKIWLKLRRRKTPILVHVHGELRDLANRGMISWLFELYLNVVARLEYMIADRVIISGAKIRKRVVRLGAQSNKIRVVPYGLKYENSEGIGNLTYRESIGLSKDQFVIGFVGRPSKAKGVDTLIKGFTLSKIPNSVLLIIGDGEELPRMRNLAASLNANARFLGYRNDVPDLLSTMNVYANLTLSEGGISGSQLEAMQAGLASVITPFTPFLKHEKEALIVNEGDAQGVANAFIRLYKDHNLRKTLATAAIATGNKVSQMYSWDSYLEGMEKVFKELGVIN